MNCPDKVGFVLPRSLRLLHVATSLFAALTLALLPARAADGGTITGSVTSSGTRNALQGAAVTIPGSNLSTFTDSAGQFVLSNVPAGAVDVVVSYSGFEDARQKVSVSNGSASPVEISMKSSELVTMQPFTVESVKEGQALAITQQRNSINPKNVTAFDEWGVLPTQNVGELASRLPGIIVGAHPSDRAWAHRQRSRRV
jgi:hypothetical protein